MAVVLVGNDSTRMHDMGDSDGTTGISAFQGQAPGAEPDFIYQGANSISRKTGTGANGINVDTSAFGPARVINMANEHLWMLKMLITNKNALEPLGLPSGILRVGSSLSDYYELDAHGPEDEFYPPTSSWLLEAWNPNKTAYQDNPTGTPVLTTVDAFGYGADFASSSQNANHALDAVDIGLGLALTRGDSTDPDGVFADFVIDDQGTLTAGRFGFFSEKDGVISILGGHFIGRNESGSAAATVFNDTGKVLVFPDSFHGNSDAGFGLDLSNASTDIDWNRISIFGRGHAKRLEFNTETEMNATSDEIQAPGFEDFRAGDYVEVQDLDGTETPGPSDSTFYWIGKDISGTAPTGVTLHTSRNDAMLHSSSAGGTPVALTLSSAGNGEIWRIRKDVNVDTRPVLVVIGTSGVLDLTDCVLEGFNVFNLTSVVTLTRCLISKTAQSSGLAVYEGCTFFGNTVEETVAFLIATTNLNNINNCSFDGSGADDRGHAISSNNDATKAMVGNTFTGYGGSTTLTDHKFDNTDDVDAGADTIAMETGDVFATGDAIVYSREITANTAVGGLSDQTRYYVNRVSAGVYSLHLNKGDAINDNTRIALTAGTGNETHALYAANAAFANVSTGLITLDITDGDTPTVRNGLDSTTVINNNITITFSPLVTGSEVRVFNNATKVEIDGVESSGTSFAFSVGSGVAFDFVILNVNQVTNIGYVDIRQDNVSRTSNATISVNQRLDDNFDAVL